MKRGAAILFLAAASAMAADLAGVKAEPNLEKRSERALLNAEAALDEARDALQAGDEKKLAAALRETGESIDLCKQSLDMSGKNARKSPKYFKKAEIGIRKLARRLDNFRLELSVDDREPVEKLIVRAHALQEEILDKIMRKK